MKLIVKGAAPAEPVVEVWLEMADGGAVNLYARNHATGRCLLLTLLNDGQCERADCVDPALGFHLDDLGRLIVAF